MNRNRLVMIGIVALALAAFVSLLLYRAAQQVAGGNKVTTTTVVATAADIPVGAKLQEKDLRLTKMVDSDLPPGAHRTVQEVLDRGVIVPMGKGELVLDSKLATSAAGAGLPSLVPTGMRAVSVKVNDVIAVAGFVTPGTRVDVVLTGTPTDKGGDQQPTTTTVLENVQVLAAGQKLQKNEQGEAQQVTVITLLVSPDDAQKLIMASQEARIQLALRNPLDTDRPVVPQLKNAELYRIQPGGNTTSPLALAKARQAPMRHFAKPAAPAAPPAPYIVEMIRGDKRDLSKF